MTEARERKIFKPNGEAPDEFEMEISDALVELSKINDFKAPMHGLYITSVKKVDTGTAGRDAAVIYVPFPQLKKFQKILTRLVNELEKKLSKHVVFIAQRRILPKPTRKSKRKNKQKRPRSRTLTAVHDAILNDLCFPAEVVGKRIRIRLDGTRLIKVHLEKSQQHNLSSKLDTYAAVYKQLTGKEVHFEFSEYTL